MAKKHWTQTARGRLRMRQIVKARHLVKKAPKPNILERRNASFFAELEAAAVLLDVTPYDLLVAIARVKYANQS